MYTARFSKLTDSLAILSRSRLDAFIGGCALHQVKILNLFFELMPFGFGEKLLVPYAYVKDHILYTTWVYMQELGQKSNP